MSIRTGDRWGRIECTDTGMMDFEFVEDGFKETYRAPAHELKCDCGKTWIVKVSDFRGKRLVRACGCGADLGGARVIRAFSMPDVLERILLQEARRRGVTASFFASECIREKLEREGLLEVAGAVAGVESSQSGEPEDEDELQER